jgi:beta-glucosidase/6-phospho-beta-glucosidase/beta-galactosidase
MLRYGIPWYKVNPAPGKFEWQWVDRVLDYIVNEGKLELMIDLNHYNCPLWIENEFINFSFPQRMAEYAYEFSSRYSEIVHFYNPYNEPVVNAILSGEIGEWPPYLHGQDGFVKVLLNLARAVVLTINIIREVDPESRFVHVEGTSSLTTEDKDLEEITRLKTERSSLLYDLVSGRLKESHPLYSYLSDNGTTEKDLIWFEDNRIELDIIGINYYPQLSHSVFSRVGSEVITKRAMGSKKQLEEQFLKYHKKYERPIILSETSFFGTSEEKVRWLEDSCSVIKKLRSQGIPIIGYNWWFMIDCIGWDYKWGQRDAQEYIGFLHPYERKGPRKGGGLYRLEPDFDGSLKRIKQPIVDTYRTYINNAKSRVGILGYKVNAQGRI